METATKTTNKKYFLDNRFYLNSPKQTLVKKLVKNGIKVKPDDRAINPDGSVNFFVDAKEPELLKIAKGYEGIIGGVYTNDRREALVHNAFEKSTIIQKEIQKEIDRLIKLEEKTKDTKKAIIINKQIVSLCLRGIASWEKSNKFINDFSNN